MRMFQLPDGRKIAEGIPFEFPSGEVARSANWLTSLTPQELTEYGIVELFEPPIPSPPVFDPAFYTLDENGIVIEKPIEQVRAYLKEQVAAARYDREDDGVQWNGHLAQTDRASRANYVGMVVAVQVGLRENNAVYKFMRGDAVPLTNSDVVPLAFAVAAYIQSLYTREAEIVAQIDALQTIDEAKAFTWSWS